MTFFDDPVTAVAALPPLVVPLVIFLSGALEYIFPPYWGDTLILVGFFLAGQGAASPVQVFAAAVIGGLAGSVVAFHLGRRYGMQIARRLTFQRKPTGTRARIRRLYERFGERVLVFNRFLPVIRGMLLYGAGAMGLRLRPVLAYSTVGNLAWVALLMAVGLLTGGTWDEIQATFRQYSRGLGLVAGGIVAAWLAWVLWRAWRRRRRPSP